MNWKGLRVWCVVALVWCLVSVCLPYAPSVEAVDTTSWFRLLTVNKDLSISLNDSTLTAKAIRVGDTVMVPLSVLHQAWGAVITVSPFGTALTIGDRHALWQGKSETFHLDLFDFPWDVPPLLLDHQRFFALKELMVPLGAYVGTQSSTGAVLAAYSTKWQQEPWLRQGQLSRLETLDLTRAGIKRISTSRKVVAFTFDDNWDGEAAVRIAELFRQYNGHCTFFVIGANVRAHPGVVRRIVQLGDDLGNHTLSHPAATKIPEATLAKQLQACEQILNGMGLTTRPYFRFPYFADDAHLMSIVTAQGYLTVGSAWTIEDTGPHRSAAHSVATVRKYISPGVIFVAHANSKATYEAMKVIVPELARQGYRFVSLTELLRGG
jgi:peptidoglycan/xylan/chitin deacetylase (PgdA/CDA1 family)